MGNWSHHVLKLVLVAGSLIAVSGKSPLRPLINCAEFSSNITNIRKSIESREFFDKKLENIGFVTPDYVFGAIPSYDTCTLINLKNAKLHTVAAQHYKSEFDIPLEKFQSMAEYCQTFARPPCKPSAVKSNKHPKYRSISGRGNNLNNPEWGASRTPFLRFGPKNYEDKIYSIKKSVTGFDLPSPRLIVQEVLTKAAISTPPEFTYCSLATLAILFVTHDVHYQAPQQPQNPENEIRCCSRNKEYQLPPNLSHAACLPIEISKNDSFYKDGNIGCMNMVRSQIVENANEVQSGEIMNLATSYMDLSLVYGNDDSELKAIRSYKSGTFRMGKNNVLPVDVNGRYINAMKRFTDLPQGCIWPSLVSRNHNHMALRLAKLNPHWSDEILFQEARRINIANFNYNFVSSGMINQAAISIGAVVNETYSGVNPGVFVEFAIFYRTLHYYLHDYMLFIDKNNVKRKVALSDTVGNTKLIVDNPDDFDAAIMGAISENLNLGPLSFEVTNKIGKDSRGFGSDLISIDIQRGRDHGTPSFLDIRRICKLTPEINSFDDYNKIFNATNVDLLKRIYASHEDVDFYVGGLLEMFENVGALLFGPTFACVFALAHNNFVQGDIYYYTHKENPYPFTEAQLTSIRNYTLSNLICTLTGLKQTNLHWGYTIGPISPLTDCSTLPEMDLSAWKENPRK